MQRNKLCVGCVISSLVALCVLAWLMYGGDLKESTAAPIPVPFEVVVKRLGSPSFTAKSFAARSNSSISFEALKIATGEARSGAPTGDYLVFCDEVTGEFIKSCLSVVALGGKSESSFAAFSQERDDVVIYAYRDDGLLQEVSRVQRLQLIVLHP